MGSGLGRLLAEQRHYQQQEQCRSEIDAAHVVPPYRRGGASGMQPATGDPIPKTERCTPGTPDRGRELTPRLRLVDGPSYR